MSRSYLFAGDIERLCSKKKQIKRLEEECSRYFDMDIPIVHPEKSTTFMGMAVMNLSLMYLVSSDKKYYQEAKRWINRIVEYKNWGNAHLVNVDLSAAWILFGLSLSYSWLKADMPKEEQETIKSEISRHAHLIYDYIENHKTDSWPVEYWQNHNWIDYTGIAVAGYALLGEDEMASVYTKAALANFRLVFTLLADDGSNYEGVVYWRYGGMWLFVYAYLALQEENIDFFSQSGYLQNTFFYKLYQSSGSLFQGIDYGDCHDHLSSNPVCVYYLIASIYRNGYSQKLAEKVLSESFEREAFCSRVKPGLAWEAGFELIWYNPSIDEKDFSNLPTHRFFPDLGLLTIRENWKDDSKIFSFKCSAPGGKKQWNVGVGFLERGINSLSLGHHHPDNQSFFLMRGDDYLTLEDGYDRAIIPGSHNTILVDGMYSDESGVNDVYMSSIKYRLVENSGYNPSEYYGKVDSFFENDGNICLSSTNDRIYPISLGVKKAIRKVFCHRMDYIIIADIIESSIPHIYTVINNSDVFPIVIGKNEYSYPTHGAFYRVFSDKEMIAEHKDIYVKSIMTTQEPENYVERYIKSLQHSSAKSCMRQVFFHIFNYDDVNLSIEYSDSVLMVRMEDESLRFSIDGDSLSAVLSECRYKF